MSTPLDDRALLARLVGFGSVSRTPNEPIAAFCAEYLERGGARVEVHPAHAEGMVNLVATVGPDPDDRRAGVVLSGHLDVVPPGDDGWTSPPFELTERDGAWYGRGSCDMQGFVALAMNVLVERAAAGRPTAPLMLVLTADEELGSLGAEHLAATWPEDRPWPRAAIIGEPTGGQVVRMHKGHAKMRLHLTGRSAHSGTPQLGANALEAAARAVDALATLRRDLANEGGPNAAHFPSAPSPVLNVGVMHGGTAINVVAEEATIAFGVRALPGQDQAALLERAVDVARTAIQATPAGEHPVTVELEPLGDNPPMETARDAAVTRILMDAIGQTEDLGVSYASDGGHFARSLGMEPVLFGPGHMRVAHRPDEHVPPAEIRSVHDRLTALIAGGAFDAAPA